MLTWKMNYLTNKKGVISGTCLPIEASKQDH